ncbi:MAG: pgl [Xanthomonadaceae bacterium]|nr:pgl [Xanthomonadaceae bacterium]
MREGQRTIERWLPTLEFHIHSNEDVWKLAVAAIVARALQERRRLTPSARPRLLVSGGSTPAPVFRALSQSTLDWPHVDIALVDERWLPSTDPDSNAHLVREHLLRGAARDARFELLARPNRSIETAVSDANLHAKHPADIVMLGMGDDGHTASLFPRMRDLNRALATPLAYIAVDASGCPGAGPWPRRISLTPAGLAPAGVRMLLIRGQQKRALLERVVKGTDPHEYPVRLAFTTPGAILQVHWCA